MARAALRRLVALIRGDGPFAAAAALSLLWIGGVVAYGAGFFGFIAAAVEGPRPAFALEIGLFALAALAPVTFFFLAAHLARAAAALREEAASLRAALADRPPSPADPDLAAALAVAARAALAEEKTALSASIAALEKAAQETRTMVARIEGRESAARREAKLALPRPAQDAAQPALPLGQEPPAAEGLSWVSVVRALDFPRDKADKAGFAALRAALKEPEFAELLQAAEDMLTLFSEDGLYMEDIAARQGKAEDWARYAAGARGAEIAAVGGVTDEVALALVRGRMRADVIFRDGALHFLRRFDRLIRRMVKELGPDALIVEAADTRSGRAFQILARVTGAFD